MQLRPFKIHPFLSLKKITGTQAIETSPTYCSYSMGWRKWILQWTSQHLKLFDLFCFWEISFFFLFSTSPWIQSVYIDGLDEMNTWIHKGALEASSKWPKAINQKMPLTKWLHHFIPSYCCLHKPPVKDTFVGIQLRRGGWTPLPLTFFT